MHRKTRQRFGTETARALLLTALSAFALAACQTKKSTSPPAVVKPAPPPPAPVALPPAPAACATDFPSRHRLYTLPATTAPADAGGGKGQPLQWAVSHPVGKSLGELSVWRDLGNGWSSLGLRLVSANASGIALRLSKAILPDKAEIWLCSPDGSTRRGPLRAGPEGELSAPVVPGAEAWLEVLAPTRALPKGGGPVLVEVYGGFR